MNYQFAELRPPKDVQAFLALIRDGWDLLGPHVRLRSRPGLHRGEPYLHRRRVWVIARREVKPIGAR